MPGVCEARDDDDDDGDGEQRCAAALKRGKVLYCRGGVALGSAKLVDWLLLRSYNLLDYD